MSINKIFLKIQNNRKTKTKKKMFYYQAKAININIENRF